MNPEIRQKPWPRPVIGTLGFLAGALGIYALLGWGLGLPAFLRPEANDIPMAPSTAVIFVALGASVLLRTRSVNRVPAEVLAAGVGGLVTLGAGTLAVMSARGIFFGIERLGLPVGTDLGGIPLGHMSPATGLLFVASGLPLFVSAVPWGARRFWQDLSRGLASLVVVIGFILVLTYLWGVEPLYRALLVPPAELTCLGFVTLGLGLFGLTTLSDPSAAAAGTTQETMSATYLLAMSALALGSITIGYLTYQTYEETYRSQIEGQLTSIGQLKVDELVDWRKERLGNAAVVADNRTFAALVRRFLDDASDMAAREAVEQRLSSYVAAYSYQRAILLDTEGDSRMSVPEDDRPAPAHVVAEAEAALRGGGVRFVDIASDEPEGSTHMAVIAPIMAGGDGGFPLAALVLQIDPETYVYPLIRRWPTGSRTAETVLVRREGDEVVYLNDLRFQPGTALNLRFPASRTDLPAAAVVSGVTGIFEGMDNRGVRVLAYLSPVAGSPWYLVVRMDLDEVYAPVRERQLETGIVVGALLVGVIAGFGLLWRQERSGQRRATAALRESQDRLQITMDTMLEGAQVIGHDWRYLYVNDAVAAQGRKAKEELIGRTMMEVYPGIDQAPFILLLRECMEKRVSHRMENLFAYADGSTGWFDLSMQPVPEGVFILSQDITERKRAEAALRRHTAQVEALNRVARIVSSSLELDEVYDDFVEELRRSLPLDRTSITLIDEPGGRWKIVRQWTSIAPSLDPGTWHSLEGSFVWEVARGRRPLVESPIDPENRWTESPHLREEGMQSRIVVPLVVKDRVTGTISITSGTADAFGEAEVALVAPMAAHLALAVENIRLYEAEREHAATLEQRVADRTAELVEVNKELEAFSYSVSHDLRAPLRAADGFSRILLEDHTAALGAEARHYLDLVRSSTQQMGRLIDELLAFSRLGRQELSRRKVDPGSIAREALEQVHPDGAGRTVDVHIGDMPEVDADPTLLRQVYVNLLANALKFTRTRNPARLRVGSKLENAERVFFVGDNGVGFDMAYADKLFGVFQRFHRLEDYEGTGVGLSIVQRVIHRHGGRVWAEGAVDKGATFYFTLPDRRRD